MDATLDTADAILTAVMGLCNDGGANPTRLELYSDDGGDYGDLLVAYDGNASPFTGPGAGEAGFRRITFAAGDFTQDGLAAAGAGTAAAHYILRSENGAVVAARLNSVRGNGDPDNGEEVVLDNANIANGQPTTLENFYVEYPYVEVNDPQAE